MQYAGMRAYQIIHSKFEEEKYAESIEIVRYYGMCYILAFLRIVRNTKD